MDSESPASLAELAVALQRKYGSNVAAAKALETTGTTIKRWLDGGPISLESALQVGSLLGIPGDRVLKATGKERELALIADVFGLSRDPSRHAHRGHSVSGGENDAQARLVAAHRDTARRIAQEITDIASDLVRISGEIAQEDRSGRMVDAGHHSRARSRAR